MRHLRVLSALVLALVAATIWLLVIKQFAWAGLFSVAMVPFFILWYRLVGEWVILMQIQQVGGRARAEDVYREFPRNGMSIVGRLIRKNLVANEEGALVVSARGRESKQPNQAL